MSGRLQGRVAIVTGAARGQGRAECAAFAAEGSIVIAADVREHDGEHLDVTDAGSWATLVDAVVAEHGRVDVLVNNAGVHHMAPLLETSAAELRRVLDINLIGPMLGMQAVVPHMPPGASIINVSSLNGLAATAGSAAYSSSKFALRGLTKAAAIELGPSGVRVNAILPGVIRTPMISYVVDQYEEPLAAGLPLRRIGEATDIASAAVFLASDESSWMTGADIVVDGGQTASIPRLL